MLKLGIIGTGKIFDLNVLGYINNEDVTISCLCNRTIEKARKKIRKFKLDEKIRIYSDFKKMIEQEELDIVEILLPHHLHAESVIYAAKKGIKGISVQKPMALSIEEANNMINKCKEHGCILSVYENFIFAPHILKAKELIDQNYIGDLISIRIKVALGAKGGWKIPKKANDWRKDPNKIGGNPKTGSPVLLDNGWHAFALGQWLYNEKIEKVYSHVDHYDEIDAPSIILWYNKNNKDKKKKIAQFGTIEFCYMPEMEIPSNYYPTDEFIEITGTKGIIWINQCTSIGNIMTASGIFPPLVIFKEGRVEKFDQFQNDWKFSFINATRHFIKTVKKGGTPILSGKQARYILKFNLAAIKSAEDNKEVFLDDL